MQNKKYFFHKGSVLGSVEKKSKPTILGTSLIICTCSFFLRMGGRGSLFLRICGWGRADPQACRPQPSVFSCLMVVSPLFVMLSMFARFRRPSTGHLKLLTFNSANKIGAIHF